MIELKDIERNQMLDVSYNGAVFKAERNMSIDTDGKVIIILKLKKNARDRRERQGHDTGKTT